MAKLRGRWQNYFQQLYPLQVGRSNAVYELGHREHGPVCSSSLIWQRRSKIKHRGATLKWASWLRGNIASAPPAHSSTHPAALTLPHTPRKSERPFVLHLIRNVSPPFTCKVIKKQWSDEHSSRECGCLLSDWDISNSWLLCNISRAFQWAGLDTKEAIIDPIKNIPLDFIYKLPLWCLVTLRFGLFCKKESSSVMLSFSFKVRVSHYSFAQHVVVMHGSQGGFCQLPNLDVTRRTFQNSQNIDFANV